MTWIDITVVTIVIAVGLIIMYRALKEPLDLLFGLIGKSIGGIRDWFIGMGSDREGYTTIRYG